MVEIWRNNQWQILQPAILIANRIKAPQERAGCMAGSQWIFGMRDGWRTIPVKLLSQLWLSFGPPCSSNSSMVFPGISGTVFGFTFWTVCTARTGQFKAVDPQYEQTIEGHKLGFVRVLARLGRTTSDQQWRLNGLRVCDTRMACICTNVDCAQVSCSRYLRKFNESARSY